MKKVTMRTMAAILIIIGGILFVISGCTAKEEARLHYPEDGIHYLDTINGWDYYSVEDGANDIHRVYGEMTDNSDYFIVFDYEITGNDTFVVCDNVSYWDEAIDISYLD